MYAKPAERMAETRTTPGDGPMPGAPAGVGGPPRRPDSAPPGSVRPGFARRPGSAPTLFQPGVQPVEHLGEVPLVVEHRVDVAGASQQAQRHVVCAGHVRVRAGQPH